MDIDPNLPYREMIREKYRQVRKQYEANKDMHNPYSVKEEMSKVEILEHMKEKLKDRGQDYGDVTENHQRQIDMINPYLSHVLGVPVNLTASQMATIMLLVKIGRLCENKNHLDTWADLIGYAACGYEMISKGDGADLEEEDDTVNPHWANDR